MAQAAELRPVTFAVADTAGIRGHIREQGYAVVRDAATPSELEEARALLWRHLGETHGWRPDEPKSWTDAAYEAPAAARGEGGGHGLGGNPRSGLLGSTVHSDCFWYCRTLPGVLTAFAAAYGTDDLVTAYDQMAINRPLTVDQPSLANMVTGRGEGVGHRWDASLHTHHNQDGFGDSVFICYAILPLYDMNEKTGATSIAPGSHTPENVAYINNYRQENAEALKDTSDPDRFLRPFWNLGLTPGPVNAKAGELCIFDTALYHSACPATEPVGNELLRAICIMSMAPRLMLSPTILRARRLAFELAQGTGGSVMGRSGRAEELLIGFEDDPEGWLEDKPPRPVRRKYDEVPKSWRQIIDGNGNFDFAGAPPESRMFVDTEVRTNNGNKNQRDREMAAWAEAYRERERQREARL